MIITLCVQFIVLQSGFSFSYHSIKRWKERYDTNVNCCKDIIFFNENTLLFRVINVLIFFVYCFIFSTRFYCSLSFLLLPWYCHLNCIFLCQPSKSSFLQRWFGLGHYRISLPDHCVVTRLTQDIGKVSAQLNTR